MQSESASGAIAHMHAFSSACMQMPAVLLLGYVQVSDGSWHCAPVKPPQSPRTGAHAFATQTSGLGQPSPHGVPIAPHAADASVAGADSPHATSATNRSQCWFIEGGISRSAPPELRTTIRSKLGHDVVVRPLTAPALRVVDWTGWSATRIHGFGATWRSVAASNLILRGHGAGMTAPRRRGALTAKFAWHGCEQYRVDARTLAADDHGWVVIGAGELYESRIAPGHEVTTVAAFIDDALVSAVRAERRASERDLLEADPERPDEPLPIGRRRLAYDRELARAVAAAATSVEPLALEELLFVTLDRILDAAAEAPRERSRLPCVRAATRAELHRRLSRAHDLLMAVYAEPIDLTRLAREAAMAPHHFLRRFRDAFGVTPHQALVRRRIERAQFLLARTDEPIATIAQAVGFESAAAFAARFRRDVGVSPRGFRKNGKLSALGPALASEA